MTDRSSSTPETSVPAAVAGRDWGTEAHHEKLRNRCASPQLEVGLAKVDDL